MHIRHVKLSPTLSFDTPKIPFQLTKIAPMLNTHIAQRTIIPNVKYALETYFLHFISLPSLSRFSANLFLNPWPIPISKYVIHLLFTDSISLLSRHLSAPQSYFPCFLLHKTSVESSYTDPSLFRTVITVLNKIFISNPKFQLLIYSVSSRTTSSKSVISLRPLTCHIPVIPGLMAILALWCSSYFSSSSCNIGLVPANVNIGTTFFQS